MDGLMYNTTVEEDSGGLLVDHILNDSVPNITDGQEEPVPDINPAFKNLIIVLYVLNIAVALIGNGCVIYLVLSQRQMRNVTNYFIASLATSDALMALVCIPITFISNVLMDSWPFPAWMCPFVTYFQVVVVFQNAFTLVAISLERYIAIMYPFKRRLSRRQCYLVIALTWFMSFGTPLPTAIVSDLVETSAEGSNDTKSYCYEIWPLDEQRFSYSMTIMVLQYFVPLAVLIYTYIRIVIVVWLKDTPPHGQMGGPSYPAFQRQNSSGPGFEAGSGRYVDPRKRIIKMMMTVVGIYGVCWLPIHIITILGDTKPEIWDHDFMRYVWVSAHWLAMSSCMYNPLIYWWMSEKFRCGYKFILRKIKYTCCKRGHDRMVLMNGRGFHFESSFSQTHDHNYRHRMLAGGGVVAGDGCPDGVGGRDGLNGGRVGVGEVGIVAHELRMVAEEMEREQEVKQKHNGVTFSSDLMVDKGETIPLRKASDMAESGLGSEYGEESDEPTYPAKV